MHTHSPSEWAAFLSLGLVPVGALMLLLAFAQANAAYFDLHRADESERAIPVLIAMGPGLYTARARARQARDRARVAAVDGLLGLLLLFNSQNGATR